LKPSYPSGHDSKDRIQLTSGLVKGILFPHTDITL